MGRTARSVAPTHTRGRSSARGRPLRPAPSAGGQRGNWVLQCRSSRQARTARACRQYCLDRVGRQVVKGRLPRPRRSEAEAERLDDWCTEDCGGSLRKPGQQCGRLNQYAEVGTCDFQRTVSRTVTFSSRFLFRTGKLFIRGIALSVCRTHIWVYSLRRAHIDVGIDALSDN